MMMKKVLMVHYGTVLTCPAHIENQGFNMELEFGRDSPGGREDDP